MQLFFQQFFALLDKSDKLRFSRFILLLFISGILGLLGIGAVIPVVNLLIDPQKIQTIHWLQGYSFTQVLVTAIGCLIAAFWLKNGMAFWSLKTQSRFLFTLAAKIQKKLFKKYLTMPYADHLNRSSPELIRNLNNETVLFANYIVNPFGVLLTESIASTLVFIILLYINPLFSITVGVALALTLIGFLRYTRRQAKHYSRLRATAWTSMTKEVMQGLGGIKETKLYHKEHFFLDRFNQHANETAYSGSFANLFQQSPRFLIETIAITVILLLLTAFMFAGYSGQQMLVLLSIFGVAAVQLLPSVNRLMQAITMIKYGLPALQTIYRDLVQQPMSEEPSISDLPIKRPTLQQAITLQDISYAYHEDHWVLRDIHLSIPKGIKIALVGESGAGKTTLIDIILGFYRPLQGQILLDGQAVTTPAALKTYQRLFSYIPQMIYLYDCSIRQNVAFGLDEVDISTEQVWNCLEAAHLSQFVQSLPAGVETVIGENGIRLSGGQRQRIGIARALYSNPDILVMDEATAALDSQTEQEVTAALYQAAANRTIITIAHRLSTIQHYDVIYVLDKGRIIAAGNYETLINQCEKFKLMAGNKLPPASVL